MARLIQESITMSRSIAALSPEALALFCLLITKLNSYGKMDGNPYTIKGSVCRFIKWLSIEKIEECLIEISENTNVKWWRDKNGNEWIHALHFEKHQPGLRKDRRGKDSLPDYPQNAKKFTLSDEVLESSTPEGEGEGEGEEEIIITPPYPPKGGMDEGLDFLENFFDGEQTVEAEMVTGRAKTHERGDPNETRNFADGEQTVEAETVTGRAKTRSRGALTKRQEADFERFWEAYPKKISKGQAKRIWKKLNPNEQLQGQILAALERAKTSDQWAKENGQFIPHASTWLNAEGWEDEHESNEDSIEAWLKNYENLGKEQRFGHA